MRKTSPKSKDKLKIISRSRQPFRDRIDAGEQLGQELKRLRLRQPVVLGIPRGGIIVAQEIARALAAPVDIALSHKLGAPGRSELAIGGIDEHGEIVLNFELCRDIGISEQYLQEEKDTQLAEIARRKQEYRAIHEKISLKNKNVILTDDGMASSASIQAALWMIQKEMPKKIVVALPVAPNIDTLKTLSRDADLLLVLKLPLAFRSASQFYDHFGTVDDEEVKGILKESYHLTQV